MVYGLVEWRLQTGRLETSDCSTDDWRLQTDRLTNGDFRLITDCQPVNDYLIKRCLFGGQSFLVVIYQICVRLAVNHPGLIGRLKTLLMVRSIAVHFRPLRWLLTPSRSV